MVALATEYSRIDYDYIISNSPIENKDLEKIKKCIEIATRITQYIRTDILFAEIVINELSGGNKHQWISINEEGDPVDIEGIDALGIIKNAKKLIKYYNRSKDDQTDEILAENLLTSLRKKYLNLKKLSTNPDINLLELREKVFKCINSFRVGSMIFAEDKRFCDIPIKELSGIESILKWFSLSSTPDLITNEECESLQRVNPKEALEYFILKKHGTVYWEELKTNLMQIEYENLVESSTEVYNNIQAKYYIISKENIDDVIKVINCLEKMYICYCLYREEHFLDQILEELLGSKKFFWFELTRNGFFISKIIIESNNEIENLFNRCIESHSSMTFEEARKRLGKEYFEKVIKSKYEELKTLVEYRRNESVDLRLNVYALILQTSILYEQTDNQSKIYEKFIYSELVEERICSWFTIEDGVMVANKYCRSNNLKPEQILNLMIEINLGFNPEFIIQEVIENRYKGEKYTYQSEFHRAKNRNNLVEDRIRMVDLIDRFKMYFKITNDRKYLRIPYNELVLNKGRIRWYRELKIRFIKFYGNPLVFRFNHYQNSLISDFDFKRERFFFKKHYYPVKEVMLQNAMLQK